MSIRGPIHSVQGKMEWEWVHYCVIRLEGKQKEWKRERQKNKKQTFCTRSNIGANLKILLGYLKVDAFDKGSATLKHPFEYR